MLGFGLGYYTSPHSILENLKGSLEFISGCGVVVCEEDFDFSLMAEEDLKLLKDDQVLTEM